MTKNKQIILIILISVLIPYLHEFGHAIGGFIDGVDFRIEYGITHYYSPDSKIYWGYIGGPLFNVVLSVIALVFAYFSNKNKLFWVIISIVFSISRLVICLIVIFLSFFNNDILLSNDEGKIATLFGAEPICFYIISIVIFTLLLIKAYKITELDVRKSIVIKTFIFNLIFSILLVFS
ncbi:hypothetical protein QTI42_02905 [Clostridium perfringens]|uniref:hypothetical protein n=1 Tax=Clostridium perfringens TaxID=1502 RepID=UPI001C854E49|nr:hypothetical protein [Clostridium perfringens]MDK0582238.1 hypothetical protein [Clostridium perfringens]MDK0737871.1 hypothetical protein [Clostridium perfringens]MDM0744583.1 hypothetical protein [Clostridium perfringens]MDM0756180.1 hypothetical protein [Clostridium perfringens]MDM0759098.1 hypothetical protein [Clostridium perfringens]